MRPPSPGVYPHFGRHAAAMLSMFGAAFATVAYAMVMPDASWSHIWPILTHPTSGRIFVLFSAFSLVCNFGVTMMLALRPIGKW